MEATRIGYESCDSDHTSCDKMSAAARSMMYRQNIRWKVGCDLMSGAHLPLLVWIVLLPLPLLRAGVVVDPSSWFILIFLEGSLYLTFAFAMLNPPLEGILLITSAHVALNKRQSSSTTQSLLQICT